MLRINASDAGMGSPSFHLQVTTLPRKRQLHAPSALMGIIIAVDFADRALFIARPAPATRTIPDAHHVTSL